MLQMLYRVRAFPMGRLLSPLLLLLLAPALHAGTVVMQSPLAGANSSGPVLIAASAKESQPFHLEVWDNGSKVGDYLTGNLHTSLQFVAGSHTTTVEAVTAEGVILDTSSVSYMVKGPTPGEIHISSPAAGLATGNAVRITASGDEGVSYHLEVWDNGYKLGNVFANAVDGVYVLPAGTHTLTVQSVTPAGKLLDRESISYQVQEECSASEAGQCDLDQMQADNTQGDCDPPQESQWVANPCGFGIQGTGGEDPIGTAIQAVVEPGLLADQGNLTLNGKALHLMELQGSQPSNVLFRGQSPSTISGSTPDSHWVLDEYVYLPDPTAHQAFEMDAQYTFQGVWTKFYTECAFNVNAGTGYWAVFDSTTGGWIFLNGKPQGGQVPPLVPCNRSQFAQPWTGSSTPSFTGWHHIAWQFLRNDDGTVTYQSLVFDGTTTQVNFHPNSAPGGETSDTGRFGSLVQLDGVVNANRAHDLVDAYVSEITLSHAP